MTNNQKAQLWWADNHPLTNVEYAFAYFPKIHYSEIKDSHILYIYQKVCGSQK